MDLLWRIGYSAAIGGFVWFLHTGLETYPEPPARSACPRRALREALLLWGVAVLVPIVRICLLAPLLERAVPYPSLRELLYVPLLSIAYLGLPLLVVLRQDGCALADLGLTWRAAAPGVAVAAVLFGMVSGTTAFVTGETVMGAEVLPAGVLVLLLYNNSFLEEFYHRGVILSQLARAIGQGQAIVLGGLLFGLSHIAFDVVRLSASEGIIFVFFAFLLQTLAGWLLGIVYVKTRSLWPGVVCHYLANWLPGILVGLTR